MKSSMVPLLLRPPSHAPGEWQRMQNSPARCTSWLAIASAACHTGSRADWAIAEVTQLSNGANVGEYSLWQNVQLVEG